MRNGLNNEIKKTEIIRKLTCWKKAGGCANVHEISLKFKYRQKGVS